jgi:nitroreductase
MSDANDVFEIMHTTRAMRRLRPDPVPDALIRKILTAGISAANGGNAQKWRFLVIKDAKVKKAVQVLYKRAFDEVIGPRYATAAPPPGITRERYQRQHRAVEYLTDHFHEAPVWIVACLDDPKPTRWSGASIYPAVQNMLLAARALAWVRPSRPATCCMRRKPKPRWACPRVSTPTPSSPSAIRWAISAR